MQSLQLEQMPEGDEKPVLRFQGKKKALVLNRVNAQTIAAEYGDETTAWAGRPIVLYATSTDFRGRPTPCIRIRAAGDAPPPPAPVAPEPDQTGGDVPF